MAEAGTTGSCRTTTSSTDYATISVAPTNTVTATVRCFTSYGYTYTTSRTVSSTSTWTAYSPGSCTLTLTSGASGTSAVAFGHADPAADLPAGALVGSSKA